MWKRKRSEENDTNKIPNSVAVAIVLAIVALTASFGVARWSWLLLDEQMDLRRELNELKLQQVQVETQYEFWFAELEKKYTETEQN